MVVEDISVIVPIYAFGLLRTCVTFSWTFSLIDSEDEVAVWAFRNFKDEEKRDKILCSWEDTEVSAGTYQGYIVRFHTNPYNEVNLDYAEL